MEFLRPSSPPRSAVDLYVSLPPFEGPMTAADQRSPSSRRSRSQESPEGTDERIYVAVSRTTEKCAASLEWAIRHFGCREIGIVHVHQPSATVPTLLGRIPARQADEVVLSCYRREETKETKKILLNYVRLCNNSQVSASVIVTTNESVQKGITDLVNHHGIRKLIMGSPSDKCEKAKRSSNKVAYIIKNAASSCEILFLHNGKYAWTREASNKQNCVGTVIGTKEVEPTKRLRSSPPESSQDSNNEPVVNEEYPIDGSVTAANLCNVENGGDIKWIQEELGIFSTSASCFQDRMSELTPSNLSTSTTAAASGLASEIKISLQMSSKEKQELSILCNEFGEAEEVVEKSKTEASAELMEQKLIGSEFANAISRVEMLEAACENEVRLKEALEDLTISTKREREQLSEERDKTLKDLEDALRDISVTEKYIQEVDHHQKKVDRELKSSEASAVNLKVEKYRIRRIREEAAYQQELWKQSCLLSSNGHGFVRFAPCDLTEFSLFELQAATCNFSDSFKIVQGGSFCVYKGEILGKTVLIKKLQAHDIQGQKEFQEQALVLSKLKHPHLVSLIGVCSEAWSLVYEYLPNGTLLDQFIPRTSTAPLLSWEVRMRIVAEVCSALLFLHSSKPENIIHGDLKPENIYLCPELHCKVGDIAVSRLVPEATLRCPSFRQYTQHTGAFPYTDPEYQRTGRPTAKSDIYSIGIIVLQLLTGLPPVGLASDVRRAMLRGKLSSILDPTAGDWPLPLAMKLAQFGLSCSQENGKDRPELTPELVRELEQLLVQEERPVPPFFLCPISQEIMHDPVTAADGFTYEGEALRGWLQNGRESSPMTNMKLDHLNLTPNHNIRFAIQDWLCQRR